MFLSLVPILKFYLFYSQSAYIVICSYLTLANMDSVDI